MTVATGPHITTEDGKAVLRGGFRTVLEDSTDYHIKHPLQSHWTLHQKLGAVGSGSSRSVTHDEWSDKLKESVTIGTVEDFWCLFNEMQPIDTIPINCDYFFMRTGVRPAWEDPANKGGGEFRLNVNRSMDGGALWQRALLFAIGAQADDHASVNGLQYAFRQNRNRMSIWLAAMEPAALDRLRDQFAAALADAIGDGNVRLEYYSFDKPASHGRDRTERPERPDRGDRRDDRGGDRSFDRERGSGGFGRGGFGRSGPMSPGMGRRP